ncbi:type II toxin-antitoxin system HicB family antitoxin [Limnoraphis robusta Tam1]|uniref:type II toxin-antitoxin system HicB family antitoxin n=1 Tax=Limnoraphis robusta TaxID=1118279 RepID=UPI002B2212D5|nr:type II toxin-antitoxin system HicB family antitoxin [Limnoraphis robusta]MEA5537507.1 type II toxin-antitoxin system HicB family antitoxin [Limnoraphis robusta Tam1]
MMNTFTAIFEKVDHWYIGYVAELPGANVQEKTLEEARESLKEAIELILQTNREMAEMIRVLNIQSIEEIPDDFGPVDLTDN